MRRAITGTRPAPALTPVHAQDLELIRRLREMGDASGLILNFWLRPSAQRLPLRPMANAASSRAGGRRLAPTNARSAGDPATRAERDLLRRSGCSTRSSSNA